MARDAYHYEATSVGGFVQQLAVSYIKNQYFFYVMGFVREGKDPRQVDAMILGNYEIARSKHVRYRSKKRGTANLQYLRFERTYVILATHGLHPFFERERAAIRDVRETPIKFHGYSLSYRGGHSCVRIAVEEFKNLKGYFRSIAATRTRAALWEEFRKLPYEPYAPVRVQLLGLLGEVNRLRKAAGKEPVDISAVRLKRKTCRPFESIGIDASEESVGLAAVN